MSIACTHSHGKIRTSQQSPKCVLRTGVSNCPWRDHGEVRYNLLRSLLISSRTRFVPDDRVRSLAKTRILLSDKHVILRWTATKLVWYSLVRSAQSASSSTRDHRGSSSPILHDAMRYNLGASNKRGLGLRHRRLLRRPGATVLLNHATPSAVDRL